MKNKLFMLLLGCKPHGRHTEQHDIFFTIGKNIKSLIDDINNFWQEAEGNIHIDAWREVSKVDDFEIKIVDRKETENQAEKLFFINLGGYKPLEFEEYHYKILTVNKDTITAKKQAKETVFYRHTYSPHIDDKYGIDVDDIFDIEDALPQHLKEKYAIKISPCNNDLPDDELYIGYTKLSDL